MFTVYILYSAAKNRYYIGSTGDIIAERLRKHNTNHKGFTGGTGDWKLRFSEIFSNKSDALKREKENEPPRRKRMKYLQRISF
jgi:putative endonuclease